jgi:outer membrane protein
MFQRTRRQPLPATGSIGLMLMVSFCFGSAPVSAESLQEALAAAYSYNPTLEAGRSELRAVDESVSIANAGYRPVISAGGSLAWEDTTIGGGGGTVAVDSTGNLTQGGINRSAEYGIGISQPIFTGLQVTNRVRAAEATVRGTRELLRDTERNILLQAVVAYVAVLSAQESVTAFEQSLNRLDKEVRVAKERVELVELTVTDLSQAELRRTSAVTLLANARADLKAARAAYLDVVGHEPSGLRFPSVARGIPKSLAEAQAIAVQENPLVVSSLYNEQAARHVVDQIRGRLLPQVSLEAGLNDEYNSSGVSFKRSTLVQGRVAVPLYDGGQTHAEIRQAKQRHLGRIQSIGATRSLVQQALTTAWSQLEAAKSRVELGNDGIRSSNIALKGVRDEEAIGQRSLLDVLNAEQDIITARVALIFARRDVVIASYQVLSQLGRLNAEELGLGTLVYDPTVHYEEVRRKWFGLDITNADGGYEHIVVQDSSEVRPPTK